MAIDGPGGQAYDIVGGLAHDDATDTTYALARNQLVTETGSRRSRFPEGGPTDSNDQRSPGVVGTVADVNVTLNITPCAMSPSWKSH